MRRAAWHVVDALLLCVIFASADSASQTVTLPACAANYVATCQAGAPPPPPPPPPPTGTGCSGFSVSPMETQWPTAANTHAPVAFFGPTVALVIHFRSGALGETASFNIQNTTGPNYNVVVASLSNASGCNVARQYPPALPILFASASQTPAMPMIVGAPIPGRPIGLQPNTDYWITVVNRLPSAGSWPGVNTCPRPDCGTGRRIDFNTN